MAEYPATFKAVSLDLISMWCAETNTGINANAGGKKLGGAHTHTQNDNIVNKINFDC